MGKVISFEDARRDRADEVDDFYEIQLTRYTNRDIGVVVRGIADSPPERKMVVIELMEEAANLLRKTIEDDHQ